MNVLIYGALGCIYSLSAHSFTVRSVFLTAIISLGSAPFGPNDPSASVHDGHFRPSTHTSLSRSGQNCWKIKEVPKRCMSENVVPELNHTKVSH